MRCHPRSNVAPLPWLDSIFLGQYRSDIITPCKVGTTNRYKSTGLMANKDQEHNMSIDKATKSNIIEKHARHDGDTGSPEVQIALLTERIQQLTRHMQEHKHDQHSRRGLLKLVGQRRRQLKYLSRTNPDSYRQLIKELGLRR